MRLNGFITDQCGAVPIKSRTVIVKINQDVACMQNGPLSCRHGNRRATQGGKSVERWHDWCLNRIKSKFMSFFLFRFCVYQWKMIIFCVSLVIEIRNRVLSIQLIHSEQLSTANSRVKSIWSSPESQQNKN